MKRVFLLFTFVFSFIGINAGIVETIKELYNYPYSLYGIVIDTPTDRENQIVYNCYIDKHSSSFKNWISAKQNTQINDTLKHNIKSVYEKYGGNIDLDNIDLFGELYTEDCILYDFFKARFISTLCQRIRTYKLEEDYYKRNIKIKFNIYNNASKEKIFFTFDLSSQDIKDGFLIDKYKGDIYEALLEKNTMLRGVRQNQKALPLKIGLGMTLDSIKIQGNNIAYYACVADLVAAMMTKEDMCVSIKQLQGNICNTINVEKLKKAKGLPLFDIRIKYEWYKYSDKQRLCSVTFAYPSLEILSSSPDSLYFDGGEIGYTEGDAETQFIPISLADGVSLGLGNCWATCNLGADSPEEYGGLYGFGDVSGERTSVDWNDYPIPNDIKHIDRMPEYDIATKELGEEYGYHIPTTKEWEDLCKYCIWVETRYKDVVGYKIIGPKGCAIFLPASGFRDNKNLYQRGISLLYWTSNIDETENRFAKYLYHETSSKTWPFIDRAPRCRGLSIRPVCD